MNYTLTELTGLLLVYSILGWIIETVVGTVKNHKFTNKGFSTGPYCLIYGISAVFMAVTLKDLTDTPIFLLIGCGLLATAMELQIAIGNGHQGHIRRPVENIFSGQQILFHGVLDMSLHRI